MLLVEFFQKSEDGYRDENSDNTTLDLKDTRKTRLTLSHLNRLRTANDVRKFENDQKSDEIVTQYSAAAAGAGAESAMPA